MSIMDMFKPQAPKPQPQQAAPAPTQTPNQQQPAPNPASNAPQPNPVQPEAGTPAGEVNNTVPNAANTPIPTQPNAESPLADFANVWETKAKEGSNDPIISIKQDELTKLASGMNFTQGVTPELLASVAGGGEASIAALQTLMGQVGQNAFVQAMQGSAALSNTAAGKAIDQVNSGIPNQLKTLQASSGLRAENTALSNPAVAPMVAMIEQQLATTYPNATAAELQTMTSTYLTQFSEAVSPKTGQEVQGTELPKNQDFTNFLG